MKNENLHALDTENYFSFHGLIEFFGYVTKSLSIVLVVSISGAGCSVSPRVTPDVVYTLGPTIENSSYRYQTECLGGRILLVLGILLWITTTGMSSRRS